MKPYLRIQNRQHPIAQPARIKYCDSFACRARGFTFHKRVDPDEGLLLVQTRDSRVDTAIHMLFVPFELAVFWIDGSFKVVDKVLAKPWRLAYVPARPARYILEIHPSRWQDYNVMDEVEFLYD